MKINKTIALMVMGVSAAMAGSTALAATTLSGTTVSYTFDETELGLFGLASLSGDNLVFSPTSFSATSSNGIPGMAAHTIHVTVTANSGYQLSAFNLTENGSYSLTGPGSVFVTGNLTALDIEGTTANEVIGTLAAAAPHMVMGAPAPWIANAGVVLPATGWGGDDGVVNSISLKITNQLYATSFPGSSSAIWKDVVMVQTVTSPVPEAQTYAMMLAGLGLVGFMARRRVRATV